MSNDTPTRFDLRSTGSVVQRRGLTAEVAGVAKPPAVIMGPIAQKRSDLQGLTANEITSLRRVIKVAKIWLRDNASAIESGESGADDWAETTIEWFGLQGVSITISEGMTLAGYGQFLQGWVDSKQAAIAKQEGAVR